MKNILGLFILISISCKAQDRNSIWAFGDSAGIDFSNISAPLPITTAVRSRGSCVSIADSIGNLLFYANTRAGMVGNSTVIWNQLNQLMQNGDSIVGQAWYNELVIIPIPEENNKYFIFSNGITMNGDQGFYYSEIDISLNNGLGEVIHNNIQIDDSSNSDCITGIKHGNGRDWWIISKPNNSTPYNSFLIYLITPDSIYAPLIYTFNNSSNVGLLNLVFNKSGEKLMQLQADGFLCEYDFDRCNGNLSNPKIIYSQQTSNFNRTFFGGAYSVDGSKFYISSTYYTNMDTSYLIQYDLNDTNITLSADTLARFSFPILGGQIRLAPNGKIYHTSSYAWGSPVYPYPDTVYNQYNMNLGVINYPDSLGAACDYQPFSFYLGGKRTYYGLPNNPNYELGPVVGSACDTIVNGIASPKSETAKLYIFFHSGWNTAFVNAEKLKGKTFNLRIVDLLGKEVYAEKGKLSSSYFTSDINCSHLAGGVYILTLETDKEIISKKFVRP